MTVLFTPYRLACSLLAARLPEDAVLFVPGGHELADVLVDSCALAVTFGGQQVVRRYAGSPRVKVLGPGRSKVVVPHGADRDRTTEMIVRVVMDDAGRGCINASAVIVDGGAEELAHNVAKNLDRIPVLSPLAEGARLGAAHLVEAEAFQALLRQVGGGARRITTSEPTACAEGMTILRPQVFLAPGIEHPLFGMELPFPFVVFADVPRDRFVEAARNSLAVIVAGSDRGLMQSLMSEPTIDKLFGGGALSTEFDPMEPHEGFLLDFLYQKKAVRTG